MGRKATSSYDVAKAAGVSQTTVSFVLNERQGARISNATRDRVRKAAVKLGYSLPRDSRSGASYEFRLVGFDPEILAKDPDALACLAGATAQFNELGVTCGWWNGPGPEHLPSLVWIREDGEPRYVVGTKVHVGAGLGLPSPSVEFDYRAAGQKAAKGISKLGIRHVRVLCGTSTPEKAWLRGIQEAMSQGTVERIDVPLALANLQGPTGKERIALLSWDPVQGRDLWREHQNSKLVWVCSRIRVPDSGIPGMFHSFYEAGMRAAEMLVAMRDGIAMPSRLGVSGRWIG